MVSWLGSRQPRQGYLKFCGCTVRIPVWIPQVCGFVVRIPVSSLWVRGEDPGWDAPSFVASAGQDPGWSTSGLWFVIRIPVKLGYLKFCGFVGIPQKCGFVVKTDTSSLWPRGPHPGWATSSFAASRSRSWLGYLNKFVASRSGSRLGYLRFCGFVVSIPIGIPQVLLNCCGFVVKTSVCGFVVRIPVGIPQVLWFRGQDPGWGTSSLWLRSQDPGWDTSSLSLRGQYSGWVLHQVSWLRCLKFLVLGYLKFCGFVPVGIPQVCGFAVKIPVGIPQVLWLRGQDGRRDTSASRSRSRSGYSSFVIPFRIYLQFVVSWLGSRQGYLKFVA